jgi:hypothetical protein
VSVKVWQIEEIDVLTFINVQRSRVIHERPGHRKQLSARAKSSSSSKLDTIPFEASKNKTAAISGAK